MTVIIAKQMNNSSQVHVKQFDSTADAAFYLKVHQNTIYKATGRYTGKPYRVKGWHIDIEKD